MLVIWDAIAPIMTSLYWFLEPRYMNFVHYITISDWLNLLCQPVVPKDRYIYIHEVKRATQLSLCEVAIYPSQSKYTGMLILIKARAS